MGKKRTALKIKYPFPGWIIGEHVSSGDIRRHKIRGELNSRKSQAENFAETAHDQSLAQPGHSLEQAVTAAHQSDEDLFDQPLVAYDGPRHFGLQRIKKASGALHPFFDFCYRFHDALEMLE